MSVCSSMLEYARIWLRVRVWIWVWVLLSVWVLGIGMGMSTDTEAVTDTSTGTSPGTSTGTGPDTDTGYLAIEYSLDFTLFTGFNNCWTACPIELHTSSSAFSTVLAYSRYQIYA